MSVSKTAAALLAASNVISASSASKGSVKDNEPRPQADLWLNVGMVSPKTGELISLPKNIALDTMEPQRIYSLSEDASPEAVLARNVRIAQNKLLEQLLELGATLGKGERSDILTLQVQVYRRGEAVADLTEEDQDAIAAEMLPDIFA